jgi:hypothetical protein
LNIDPGQHSRDHGHEYGTAEHVADKNAEYSAGQCPRPPGLGAMSRRRATSLV